MRISLINKIYQKLFYADKWNIGYIDQDKEKLISERGFTNTVTWLKEDPADYCADPFVLRFQDNTYVYYEYLNHWSGLGQIYRIENFDFKTKIKVSGLDLSLHLSYPYIFEDDSSIYCIPETARANEIGLYEVDKTDLTHLQKRRVLVFGAQYVDSSIIKYNGKYWLFTNKRNNKDLYIFYSDSLFGEFLPHKMNPIQGKENTFRSGGKLFIVQNVLYRPTQNLEIRYGGSLIINKIKELTEDRFENEALFEIEPIFPYNLGLHNISFADNKIIIDGKKSSFSLLMPIKLFLRYYRLWKLRFRFHSKSFQ